MPLSNAQRIESQLPLPRHVELWRALQPLKSCVSFMNTGAHPDDETSAMLSLLNLRHGLAISFACANRGEGGQNDIGTEVSENLGVIRTAEMERAADVLDMRLYWLSESTDDSIFDFGFSKSGEETLKRWGRERTLNRMVAILRTERPDIVCTTFLDVPGQHGHHRAMTEIVLQAVQVAGDSAYNSDGLPAWQVSKCYLPAWSGAGDAYDDDLPPPEATLLLNGQGEDPITGWTYEQTGQHSRVMHKTQGMGRWLSRGKERNWPLHLAASWIEGDDQAIEAGLPGTLAQLPAYASADAISGPLEAAQSAIDQALSSFPDLECIRSSASEAVTQLRLASELCPPAARHQVIHRLQRKERQLARVIRIAARTTTLGWLERDEWRAGDHAGLQTEVYKGDADTVRVELMLPPHWTQHGRSVSIEADCSASDPYPAHYFPDEPSLPALNVTLLVDGVETQSVVPLNTPPIVLPPVSARLNPTMTIINTAISQRTVDVTVTEQFPVDSTLTLQTPANWQTKRTTDGFSLTVPILDKSQRSTFSLLVDEQPALTLDRFHYPHIHPRVRAVPAQVTVQSVDARLSRARVGYVGGGNDNVFQRLSELGCEPIALDDEDLEAGSGLRNVDTVLIGVFAFRTRAALQNNLAALHDWVKRGGNLVTLYHRPWDCWDPERVPPLPLTIGKPSLRYRVTDESAAVTHLLPEHPLLNYPNTITDTDWQGWHKERGLYFAQSWDPAYEALLSMADPDESAHTGALLSARIGLGRHTHTSLILHHQMEKLVPGAYRLMANLVACSDE